MPASDEPDHILVLAAGRGTRMGGPKALMTVAGRPWWRYQQDRLAAAGIPATWLVSDAVHAALASEPAAPSALIAANSDAPMFDTLLHGVDALRLARRRGVYILPIDVPVPSPAVWSALSPSDLPAIPSFKGKHGHPVYLPWSWIESTLLPARATLPPDRRRLDLLIAPIARTIVTDDPAVVTNLNSPADVESWLATKRAAGAP